MFHPMVSNKLNPKADIPLFATNVNPLQLYHSLRAIILTFKLEDAFGGPGSGLLRQVIS